KAIAEAMGTSITQTSQDVKMAIKDLRNIIHHGNALAHKQKCSGNDDDVTAPGVLTEEQGRVLELRCNKKYSFTLIAEVMELSQKEVHKEFAAAYKLWQVRQEEQL